MSGAAAADCRMGGNDMFGKKKKMKEIKPYDPAQQIPVIRASICTGEKTAGFEDRGTGKFEDLMLIASEEDLQEFCRTYGVDPEDIVTKW